MIYLQYTLLLLILISFTSLSPTVTEFTIHFATINTFATFKVVPDPKKFTIHFATINTFSGQSVLLQFCYLQYTLLLLILMDAISNIKKQILFTIHFATINT